MIWVLHFVSANGEYIAIYDHEPEEDERDLGLGFRLESEITLEGELPTTFPSNRTFRPE